MTASNCSYDRFRRLFAAWLVVCAMMPAGCRSTGNGSANGGSSGGSRSNDPLLGVKIPPQDLPIPGKDGYAGGRRDPLLTNPTGGTRDQGAAETASGSKDGNLSALPPRSSGSVPYRPTPDVSNAALATASATLPVDDKELSIGDRGNSTPTDDRRPLAASAGTSRGPVPLRPRDLTAPMSIPGPKSQNPDLSADYTQAVAELKRLGATVEAPISENGSYVLRCDVPIGDQPGAVRRYEGVGATPAAAAKQALDLARSDRAK